jgi:hypothetical protein
MPEGKRRGFVSLRPSATPNTAKRMEGCLVRLNSGKGHMIGKESGKIINAHA